MTKRAKKKLIQKKPIKKAISKKKRTVKEPSLQSSLNKKALWDAYKDLQKKVDKAWATLKRNVQKKANAQILERDKNHLLLLLGECNYMARECMQISKNKN